MKVIHYLHELKFSGAEIMYVDAAPIFQKLGCDLSVVNTTTHLGEYAPCFEEAGYKFFHIPYPKNYFKRWEYYKRTIAFLKDEKYDVVHIHSSNLKWGMSYCAWKAGCKSVYTFHAVFSSHWYSFLYHVWLRWCAKKIFKCNFQSISDSVYQHEKNYYLNETTKIYNWYGSSRFYPACNSNEKFHIREILNIPQDALVIISVGGCRHLKRHDEIIKALSIIAKTDPNIIYLHLGEGNTINEEIELAKELQVYDKIRFYGNQNDVRKYLIASDIYIMTSLNEGISLTTIEAMACKIPCILYNVPGLRDFNKEKECSDLIEENYKTLAETILKLYKDKARRKFLIDNAKDFVDKNFFLETNVKKIFELYNK